MTRHPGPPLLSNHPTRVPIDWARAEDSKNYTIFRESGPVKFWRTPPEFPDKFPWTPPPDPLKIDLIIYQSIAVDVKIPNI